MADSFVFTSASDIDKEFFGGGSSNNVNPEEVKKETEQQKENQNKQEPKKEQKQEETQQQKNIFKENSVKSLKDLGFETKDNKKFFRKIKQFDVQIELP